MSFSHVNCVTVDCDRCGPDWWHGHTNVRPIFASTSEASTELIHDFGWRISSSPAGTRMVCNVCAVRDDCERYGHQPHPAETDDELVGGETCRRCHRILSPPLLATPPPGHPDSVTARLDDDTERWLAAVDAYEFPREANAS